MKGFIKVTQTNNQLTYINISNIIKFYRSKAEEVSIVTVDLEVIKTKLTLEDIEKLIHNASTL
ncbi:hypothetical protein [Flavobacterium sp.]|uniref:hypothetical protein n=1 Tax=Flavobacterium sp. TaxID=239 RepID=UPI004047856B